MRKKILSPHEALQQLIDEHLGPVKAVRTYAPDPAFPTRDEWLLTETCELLKVDRAEMLDRLEPGTERFVDAVVVNGTPAVRDVLLEPGLFHVLFASDTEISWEFQALFADAMVNIRKHGTPEVPKRTVRGIPVVERPDGSLEPVRSAPELKKEFNAKLNAVFEGTEPQGLFLGDET